jgi:PAS domain S-box-containing protein
VPKAKILIVEDEKIIAKYLQNTLKGLGYDISAIVSSGEEAIKKAEEIKPDLVLMDIVLKGDMDGIEAAEKIGLLFDIPVVYLTAYPDEKLFQRAKITDPFGYILKPVEKRDLKIAIEIALYKHEITKKLKESEEWFSTTLRSIGDAVITTDIKGCVTFINSVAERMLGWKEEEALGKLLEDIFYTVDEETGEPVENPVREILREGMIVGLKNVVLINKDGLKISIEDSGAPIKSEKGTLSGVVLVFHDVTERKRAEGERKRLFKEVFASREELGRLSHRVVEVQETVRRDLARELHDRIGQALAALGITLNLIRNQLSTSLGPQAVARLDDSLKLVEEMTICIRDLMAELRPPVLDDYGLLAALRWYGEQVSDRTGVIMVLKGEELTPRLPLEVEATLFRIAQEALANVVRHAQANRVTLTLEEVTGGARLTIADDGRGFDLNALSQLKERPGWGLITMRERAEAVGGKLDVESAPKKGTRVIVEVPRSK